MADLNTDVRYIKGIGEAKAKSLGKLGANHKINANLAISEG